MSAATEAASGAPADTVASKADERRAFVTDVSLIGGLIIAAVDTEGKPSLGWRGRRAAHKVSEAVTAALPVGAPGPISSAPTSTPLGAAPGAPDPGR